MRDQRTSSVPFTLVPARTSEVMSLIFPDLAAPRRALPLGELSTLDLAAIPRHRENRGTGFTGRGGDESNTQTNSKPCELQRNKSVGISYNESCSVPGWGAWLQPDRAVSDDTIFASVRFVNASS